MSTLRPGTRSFTVVLSMVMATTALAIDLLLPAFDEIRAHLGLDADSTEVAGLITAFMIGSGLGLLPAGLLADRFGRRPVLLGGLAIYALGAIGAVLAPSLGIMLVARFLWGFGSAGPRVAAIAIVRDAFSGEKMARQMSAIMSIFLVVPALAPSFGVVLLAIGSWHLLFWFCAVAAVGVGVASLRLPTTLAPEARRRISVAEVGEGFRIVFTAPGTTLYLIALTVMYSGFISYLGTSEIVLDEVFGQGDWFPVVFGVVAACMGASAFLNGRLVERFGLDRSIAAQLGGYLASAVAWMILAFAWSGPPPLGLYLVCLVATFSCQAALLPNVNSATMRPLGRVAGTSAAVLGMVPSVLGAVLASVIDRAFDGTIRPFAVGLFVAAIVATVATRLAAASVARVDGVGLDLT